jgi:glycosyltransferase involved in cell wall biosynthesis
MLGPKCAGLGRYIEQLLIHLQTIDQSNQYVIFLRKENFASFLITNHLWKKVLADIPWYSFAEQTKLKKIIDEERVDLMHFPHWNVPLLYNKPFVVTVHDLIMWHFPRQEASTHGPLLYWFKDRVSHLVVKHAVSAAKHILTTSEFTKYDIHKTLHVPLQKMTVTYQAPYSHKQSAISNQQLILNRYSITKPYVLYVGSAYPHKNLDRLVEAWKLVEEKCGDKYQLVLVGKDSYFYRKLSAISQKQSAIIFTGFVPDEELESLYAQAELYVAPSLYEGFALPALEAIHRGLPVAASNSSCFPEVLGSAALYFDPVNIGYMADTICQGLADKNVRFELGRQGAEELKRYSWERLAKQTLAAYCS